MTMKIGSQTGSLMNHLMSAGSGTAPEVGMGATVLSYSDRYAGTIIEVGGTEKRPEIVVQQDHAKRTDDHGMSDMQSYDYTPDPEGRTYRFRLMKRGWKQVGDDNRVFDGYGLLIGDRREFYDYTR